MKFIKINLAVIIVLSLYLFTFTFTGCGKSDNKTSDKNSPDQKSETTTGTVQSQNTNSGEGEVIEIKLPTMQCSTCKKTIESAVKKIDGVSDVNVVVKDKVAKVKYDKSKTDPDKIEGVIVMAGYQANDKPANKESYDKLESCCKISGH